MNRELNLFSIKSAECEREHFLVVGPVEIRGFELK